MKLTDLLADITVHSKVPNINVTGIKTNSQSVESGDLFLATTGVTLDRHEFIDDAIQKGAVAVIVRNDYVASESAAKVAVVRVDDVNAIADRLFARFYAHPERELKMLAVTGTDGKTSVARIVQQLIGEEKCGMIGTMGAIDGKMHVELPNTTPDSDVIYKLLRDFADRGAETVIMEFSSEAEHHKRLRDLTFDAIGFTNITSEHLNVHKTQENYVNTKVRIFINHLKPKGTAVLNFDDKNASTIADAMANELKSGNTVYYTLMAPPSIRVTKLPARTPFLIQHYKLRTASTQISLEIDQEIYGDKKHKPEYIYVIGNYNGEEIRTRIDRSDNDDYVYEVESPLVGKFNIQNLLCALNLCMQAGYSFDYLLPRISNINVEGRMDFINAGQDYKVLVDYAHTPNGITQVFNFAKELHVKGDVITVIGQAGERDRTKRAEVGKIATDKSTKVIFTADEPRNEDVNGTIKDITKNLTNENWEAVPNRAEAIKHAVAIAKKDDLLLILGRGADTEWKEKGTVTHFSDEECITDAIKATLGSAQ
jgi:UDP-N-acetylmuramoyl-L-alanyl-D-glutamate--2,6-diaminopimelate ligase